MKIAYTVGMPDTRGPMYAYQGELEKVLQELSDIGYDGIEPFVRNPLDLDMGQFIRLIEKTGLEVPVVGTAPILEDKLSLTDSSAEVRQAAVTRIKAIIDFAVISGARVVSIGKSRGNFPPACREEAGQWLRSGMEQICDYAGEKGLIVTIEPQNKMNINNLNTTQDGLRWIQSTGLPNLMIILDTYHMNIEDQSLIASLVEAGPYIGHMHIADSNRGVPGHGNIDFIEVLRVLKALKYNGYLSLEIAQMPDGFTAAKKSWEYLNFVQGNLL